MHWRDAGLLDTVFIVTSVTNSSWCMYQVFHSLSHWVVNCIITETHNGGYLSAKSLIYSRFYFTYPYFLGTLSLIRTCPGLNLIIIKFNLKYFLQLCTYFRQCYRNVKTRIYCLPMNLHKHQLYLLEQHRESFKIWSAIIRINTEGISLITKSRTVLRKHLGKT